MIMDKYCNVCRKVTNHRLVHDINSTFYMNRLCVQCEYLAKRITNIYNDKKKDVRSFYETKY